MITEQDFHLNALGEGKQLPFIELVLECFKKKRILTPPRELPKTTRQGPVSAVGLSLALHRFT